MLKMLSIAVPLLFIQLAFADGQTFRSSPLRTNVVELFSSEGCSSCPPADRWLSSLRGNEFLWKSFVPLEFHVDYWNQLGWVDRNSKSAFTQRQRRYARGWNRDTVYTPGVVLNGQEWRPSFDMNNTGVKRELTQAGPEVGELDATQISPDRYRVVFHASKPHSSVVVHGAALGNKLVSHVLSGENKGSDLKHDFVVLSVNQQKMKKDGMVFIGEIDVSPSINGVASDRSVAFWVTENENEEPLQAVGGDLAK
jgi:hypothetical protein